MSNNIPNITIQTKDHQELTIKFKEIVLENIRDGGKYSVDNKDTYNRLAEIANDFNSLTNMLGTFVGGLVYLLPTGWKAGKFIKGMIESPGREYLLIDEVTDDTIGTYSFNKLSDKLYVEYELDSATAYYNVGVMFKYKFVNTGILTAIIPHLEKQNIDHGQLLIATRYDNICVNYLAEKFDFTLLKTMTVYTKNIFPWTVKINMNLYTKELFVDRCHLPKLVKN